MLLQQCLNQSKDDPTDQTVINQFNQSESNRCFVQISIFIKHLFYRECERKSSHNHVKQDNQSKPYADDDEEFLKLVDDTYPDEELVEWSPAPTYAGDPNEPGYLGAPVVVPPEKQEEAKRRFTENHFDIVASEMMPLNRTLADGRYPE